MAQSATTKQAYLSIYAGTIRRSRHQRVTSSSEETFARNLKNIYTVPTAGTLTITFNAESIPGQAAAEVTDGSSILLKVTEIE